jgi:hypothetical protein
MATIKQLFKIKDQIQTTEAKLRELNANQQTILSKLGFTTPNFCEKQREHLIEFDGKPYRLTTDWIGGFHVEELTFKKTL